MVVVVAGDQEKDGGCRSETGLFMQVEADDRFEVVCRSALQSETECALARYNGKREKVMARRGLSS